MPTKDILNKLSSKFNIDYLCVDGYTKLISNFDEFLDRIKLWIEKNNLSKSDAATKLGVSHGLFRFWFNGGIIKISTYNKVKNNLEKFKLIE